MYRKSFVATERNITIQLPEDFVNEEVEIVAFKKSKDDSSFAQKKKMAAEAVDYFNTVSVDMSGFKFNRDEANER